MPLALDLVTLVVNFALFQASWLACVLGAAHGLPWVGALAGALAVGWHLARATRPGRELALIALAASLGALFETALVQRGWTRFGNGVLLSGTAPYWMVALWAIFATTLNVSLRALRPHPWLAALLGAACGPAAYYAGARLGALELTVPGAAIAALAMGWAILTPALLLAARRLDGYARP
jgi:hypothetical protein